MAEKKATKKETKVDKAIKKEKKTTQKKAPKPKGFKTPKIEDLLDAGVHFGHQVRRWNPNMEPYIYAHKKGIHIIDLEQTEVLLKEACDFAFQTAATGGKIVFVGTKRQAKDIVELEAKRSGALYITERWLGGTITNFAVIRKNIDKLLDLKVKRDNNEFENYTKKERLLIDREIEKLERFVGGITTLKGKPAMLFVVDARREKTAIREANRAEVPVVALIDTNSDPTPIDYVIPGNDDAIRSIALVVKSIADAVESGYAEYAKIAEKERKELEKAKKQAEKAAAKAEEKALSEKEVDKLTAAAVEDSEELKEEVAEDILAKEEDAVDMTEELREGDDKEGSEAKEKSAKKSGKKDLGKDSEKEKVADDKKSEKGKKNAKKSSKK
jgi:small subunit ribosomal protein S2